MIILFLFFPFHVFKHCPKTHFLLKLLSGLLKYTESLDIFQSYLIRLLPTEVKVPFVIHKIYKWELLHFPLFRDDVKVRICLLQC